MSEALWGATQMVWRCKGAKVWTGGAPKCPGVHNGKSQAVEIKKVYAVVDLRCTTGANKNECASNLRFERSTCTKDEKDTVLY